MKTVTSKDGTIIAYDEYGSGKPVIFVSGALQYRAFGQGMVELAELLAPHFTAIFYDRRGRGDSTDTQPSGLQREIEDIEALIDAHGGSAHVYGISSGAALAFEAALALGGKVEKLAMYEAPYNDDADARKAWVDYSNDVRTITAEGRKGDAVGRFMMLVGMPPEALEGMRHHPDWHLWESIGHTLVYDAVAMGEESAVPLDRAARLSMPVLTMNGSESYPFMHTSAAALASAMPHGQHRALEGQTHEVAADAVAPVLIEFFRS